MRKIILPIIMLCGVANADTCVRSNFTVTYSCGDGTLADGQTLPAEQTVNYTSIFTPNTMTYDMCVPPAGFTQVGFSVYINNKEVFFGKSIGKFSYYYTDDITIAPHYEQVAKPEILARLPLGSGYYNLNYSAPYGTDTTTNTWYKTFYFGTIRATTKTCDVKPENTAEKAFFVPNTTKQKEIEEATSNSGNYCYCKLIEPYLEDSPWVYVYVNPSYYKNCLEACSGTFSNLGNSPSHALFSAATKQLLEQAGAE